MFDATDLYLFDYDGTICDSRRAIVHTIRRTFAEIGQAVTEERALRAVALGGTLEQTLARAGAVDPDDDVGSMATLYRRIYREEGEEKVVPFAGAVEVLLELARDNTLVVLSNKGEGALHRSLDALGLSEAVDLVVGERSGLRKPDPGLFDSVVAPRYPDTSREAMLMVGDAAVDLEFAAAVGLRSCWAAYGYGDPEHCERIGFDRRIDALQELIG